MFILIIIFLINNNNIVAFQLFVGESMEWSEIENKTNIKYNTTFNLTICQIFFFSWIQDRTKKRFVILNTFVLFSSKTMLILMICCCGGGGGDVEGERQRLKNYFEITEWLNGLQIVK